MPNLQQVMMPVALQIIECDDCFLELDSRDVDEYNMVKRFYFTTTDPMKQIGLLYAIKEKGAFRKYKN